MPTFHATWQVLVGKDVGGEYVAYYRKTEFIFDVERYLKEVLADVVFCGLCLQLCIHASVHC